MEKMSRLLPRGQYLYSPDGSHLAMYDDPQVCMDGLIHFLKDVESRCPDAVAKISSN